MRGARPEAVDQRGLSSLHRETVFPMCEVNAATLTEDEFISIAEAVRRGYPSRQTIWRYIRDGKVIAVRVGRENRVSVADLDRMAREHPTKPDEDAAYHDLVRRTVTVAPKLTPEQASRLRAILAPVAGE